MTDAAVLAPVASATATAISPRAIYVTGYDPQVFPTVVSMSASALAPSSLYVGPDLDHKPYRPPVYGRRGWRVAVGPPIAALPSVATATVAADAPVAVVSPASLIADRATATVVAPAPQVGISYSVDAPEATGTADTATTAVGEYRNPYVVDDIATATIETYLADTSASVNLDLTTATASAQTATVSTSLTVPPGVAAATTSGTAPAVAANVVATITATTASAAALAPVTAASATAAVPVITATADTIAPTTAAGVLINPDVAAATASAPAPLAELVIFGQPPVATATATAINPTARTQVTFKGANAAISTSATIPAHNAGDLILIWAYQNNASNLPSKPAAGGTVPTWTDITTNPGVGSVNRYAVFRTAYAVATSSNTTTGTWSGADVVMAVVLSGQAASPIGGVGEANATGTITGTTAPAVTMSDTTGTSMLLHFMAFHVATGFLFYNTTPSGYTDRYNDNATYSGWQLLTKNVTTTDGAVTSPLSGTASSGASGGITIEIVAQ